MATANYYGLTGGCGNGNVYPTAPVTFAATADGTDPFITLSWDNTDADYEVGSIDYSLDEVTWVFLTYFEIPSPVAAGEYIHTGLEADTQYFYRMRVHKRTKWSEYATDDDTTAA
jgi:hypothetical protein